MRKRTNKKTEDAAFVGFKSLGEERHGRMHRQTAIFIALLTNIMS